MFKLLQHRIFYKVFSEDYMILRTQTYNNQMGYVIKDNVKLLGEDKMVQYYWDWLQSALKKDRPWDLHRTNSDTNTVHQDTAMLYPPENPTIANSNDRNLVIQLILRALIPIGGILFIIL